LEWPICYKEDLILGNAKNNTAICTLWTKREMLDDLPKDKFSVIGNLYSTYGINPMLRNLSANPRTRYIIVCGADLIHTGDILLNFINNGIEEDYKVKGVEAYIDSAFSRDTLEELRKNIKAIDLRNEKDVEQLKSVVGQKLSEISKEEENYMEPILVEEKEQHVEDMLVEDIAYRIEGNSISSVWLKALDCVLKFGESKNTEYGMKQKEIFDLVSVIKGDDIGLPEWLPVKEADLDDYYKNFFSKEKPLGVEYTYGERLFNLKLSRMSEYDKNVLKEMHNEASTALDQVDSAIKKLKEVPYSRRAIAITWRHESDTNASNPPCLIEISWSIKYSKLYQTATFRSHDIFGAWLLNVYTLRKLQKDIAKELNIDIGSLIVVSISAHIYQNNLNRAEELTEKYYRNREVPFEKDLRGFFVVTVENGEIVVQHRIGNGRKSNYTFKGKKAQRIYRLILNENLVSRLDHAAYLGKELARAEECLDTNKKYVQDEA
jgi:thymidylate synthase